MRSIPYRRGQAFKLNQKELMRQHAADLETGKKAPKTGGKNQ